MPIKRGLDVKAVSPRNITLYLLAALAIALAIYYFPSYFFLEELIAHHTASLLNMIGVAVQSRVVEGKAFVDQIRIVKDCTGIQVIAVFLGLILPLPNASLRKKAVVLLVLSGILYVANILRITLEFWLVHFDVVPWVLAHYPLSLLLGVVGVFFLVLVTDRLLPEFGELLFHIAESVSSVGEGWDTRRGRSSLHEKE
jgi:exosortase/archaeosortase family protein